MSVFMRSADSCDIAYKFVIRPANYTIVWVYPIQGMLMFHDFGRVNIRDCRKHTATSSRSRGQTMRKKRRSITLRGTSALVATLCFVLGTQSAWAMPLSFTPATDDVGPVHPPLPPVRWDVSTESRLAYSLQLTVETLSPLTDVTFGSGIEFDNGILGIILLPNGEYGVQTGGTVEIGMKIALSSLRGDLIPIAGARSDSTGGSRLSFDANLDRREIVSNSISYFTRQPGTISVTDALVFRFSPGGSAETSR